MSNKTVAEIEQRVESLHDRVDELLKKLSQANGLIQSLATKVDELPSEDYWIDYSSRMPQASGLQEFSEAWDKLPSIVELQEYAEAAAGLQAAE